LSNYICHCVEFTDLIRLVNSKRKAYTYKREKQKPLVDARGTNKDTYGK
jgi:hypothetical protein